MSKGFILIAGHGIFPQDSITQVVPNIKENFSLEIEQPDLSIEEFKFNIIKNTEVALDVHVLLQGKNQVFSDKSYGSTIVEISNLSEQELLKIFYEDSQDNTVVTAISNYKRRLRKAEEYQQKISIIKQQPDLPDYESSVAAIAKDAPGSDFIVKQEKSISRIKSHLQEKIMEIIEASDKDNNEELEEHRLISMFETEERIYEIENRVNNALRAFYNVNIDDIYDINDSYPTSENLHNILNEAERIKDDPDTLRNNFEPLDNNFEPYVDNKVIDNT